MPFSLVFSQNQSVADSLIFQYKLSSNSDDTIKLKILKGIFENHTDQDSVLYYTEIGLRFANNIESDLWKYTIYFEKGNAYSIKGDLDLALESYLKSQSYAKKLNHAQGSALALSAMGDVYSTLGNKKNSLSYYNQAINEFRIINDSVSLATALLNTGDEYFNNEILDSALYYFEESSIIFEKLDSEIGKAYNVGNLGLVFAKQGNYQRAEDNIQQATVILEKLGDRYPIAEYEISMADIYLEKNNWDRALGHAENSLAIALDEGLKEQVRDASLKLSEIHQQSGDYQQAFEYQSQYIAYRDSINDAETIQRMADLRTDFEVAQKQSELDLANKTKENQRVVGIGLTIVLLLLGLLAVVLFKNNQKEKRSNLLLSEQKAEITSQRDQLSDLNNTKDRFFSIISHDLRGPVNAFQGVTRIIKTYADRNQLEKIPAVLDVVDKSSSQLSSLLDNLLNWALSQQGNFPYHPEQLDVTYLGEELMEIFKHMSLAKQINISAEIEESTTIYGDRNSVMAILRNLISNAIKFTPENGDIKLEAKKNGQYAYISVKDNGMGITPDKIDKLFVLKDKKQSVDGTAGEKGTGLGLMICKEFAELNGGDINVESEVGVGTRFTINLPLFAGQQKS